MKTKEMPRQWAQRMLASEALILDTETTGVRGNDQIIQLAVINMADAVLMDTLLRPTCAISAGAARIHGLTADRLADAPTIADYADTLPMLLLGRPLIIYNAPFDCTMLRQSLSAYELPFAWLKELDVYCAMRIYASHLGAPRWRRLPGGDHSARGDCRATLELIKSIAA